MSGKKPTRKRGKRGKNLRTWLIPHLRNLSRMWPPKSETLKEATVFVQEGFYLNGKPKMVSKRKCAMCEGNFPIKGVQVDHIIPVANHYGFQTWDEYILGLFCDKSNLQVLCIGCHDLKTQMEREAKRMISDDDLY